MELSSALRFGRNTFERPVFNDREAAIRIGIVGCGSRGLTVLERLCALAGQSERRVEIHVFDPRQPGRTALGGTARLVDAQHCGVADFHRFPTRLHWVAQWAAGAEFL